MVDNCGYLLLGLLLVLFGILIIIDPIFVSKGLGIRFDFSDAKWFFGLMNIAVGMGFIWTVIKKIIFRKNFH